MQRGSLISCRRRSSLKANWPACSVAAAELADSEKRVLSVANGRFGAFLLFAPLHPIIVSGSA